MNSRIFYIKKNIKMKKKIISNKYIITSLDFNFVFHKYKAKLFLFLESKFSFEFLKK